jgi:endonuclease YncB( thermonuclease family)
MRRKKQRGYKGSVSRAPMFAVELYFQFYPRLCLVESGARAIIRSMFLMRPSFALPPRGATLLLAAACFAAGLGAGTLTGPVAASRDLERAPPSHAEPTTGPLRSGHPAEVIRVLDGDTFEARVRIWPGMDVTTRVRLRGIDAPEMRARCEDERTKALAARDALARILSEGAVGISSIGQDKYGGRVDADVSTLRTPDVSAALLERGLARRYSGGRRASWCG